MALVVGAPHPQRPIPGIHQIDGGVHDGAQRGVEFQPRRDDQDGLDETVQPVAALDDLLDSVLDLQQQLPQTQLRQRFAHQRCARVRARSASLGHINMLALMPPPGQSAVRLGQGNRI